MNSVFAICRQTLRASLRHRVFHLLLALVLVVGIAIPLTASGDGTAAGETRMILTYTLGLTALLLSAATLWIACTGLSREIEGYQIHLVQNSAATRTRIWIGKWLGVFLPHALLLFVAGAAIYGTLQWKMKHWTYPEADRQRAREEVLSGRMEFMPQQPDFAALVEKEYQRRLAARELDPQHNPETVKSELLRMAKARSTEIPPGATRLWVYRDLKGLPPGRPLSIRYRPFLGGSTTRNLQRPTEGVWMIRTPGEEDRFQVLPQRTLSGVFHELVIPPELVAPDGTLVLGYNNQDSGDSSVMFQLADGPAVLIPATGFAANFSRALFLILVQLAFLAALGVTVSGIFSSPVAMFVAVTYLVIGLTVQTALNAPVKDEFGRYQYKNVVEMAEHQVARVSSVLVASVEDFDAVPDLVRGRLIRGERVLRALALHVGLRILPLALVGVWLFNRRELGLVIRTA